MFYTYILRSLSQPEQRYIGSTADLTSRFKKDYKLLMKQGADMSLLDDVIRLLSSGETLPMSGARFASRSVRAAKERSISVSA